MSGPPSFASDVMAHLEHVDFGPIVYSISTENIAPIALDTSPRDEKEKQFSLLLTNLAYFMLLHLIPSHARSELEVLLDMLDANKVDQVLQLWKINLPKQRNFVLAHNLVLSYGLCIKQLSEAASTLAEKFMERSKYALLHDKLIVAARNLMANGWFLTPSGVSFVEKDAFFLIDYSYSKCGSLHSPTHKYAKLVIDVQSNDIVLRDIPPHHLQCWQLAIRLCDANSDSPPLERHQAGEVIPPTDFNTTLLKARRYLLDEEIYTRLLNEALKAVPVEICSSGFSFTLGTRKIHVSLDNYKTLSPFDTLLTLFLQQYALQGHMDVMRNRQREDSSLLSKLRKLVA